MSVMADAFERAGYSRTEMELFAAVDRFRKAGGTRGQAVSLVGRCFDQKLPGEAFHVEPLGHLTRASSRQPNGDDVGHTAIASGRFRSAPSSPPERSEAGQPYSADGRSLAAPSLRAVSPSPAHIRAAATVAKQAAVTVLDTWKIRDGRAIGDVRFGEIETLRATNAQEASLLRQIQRHAVADSSARVRDVVKPETLQRMLQRAAEVADAA